MRISAWSIPNLDPAGNPLIISSFPDFLCVLGDFFPSKRERIPGGAHSPLDFWDFGRAARKNGNSQSSIAASSTLKVIPCFPLHPRVIWTAPNKDILGKTWNFRILLLLKKHPENPRPKASNQDHGSLLNPNSGLIRAIQSPIPHPSARIHVLSSSGASWKTIGIIPHGDGANFGLNSAGRRSPG